MEIKKNIDELAIMGGPSLFPNKLHVGRPNIGDIKTFHGRVDKIFENVWLTNNGPFVRELEDKIAKFLGVKNFISVSNGTLGLEMAARGLNLTGEVIVPSFTFVATPHSLKWMGIKPVFCDIDPNTHNIDPQKVESLITPDTSAILGVHVWGRPCDIEMLERISLENNIKLYFDAAHAFGCSYKDRMLGNYGLAEVFSFHATKFFNTFEGGGIATNDDNLAERFRLMRNFGFAGYDNVIGIGINAKMTEVCAAMGLTGLEGIDGFISVNYQNYKSYMNELQSIDGIKFVEYNEAEKNNYQYVVIEVDASKTGISRDDLIKILHAENVLARRYFYPGCHQMSPYEDVCKFDNSLLQTEIIANRVISLPTGTGITRDEIKKVCSLIKFSIENEVAIRKKLRTFGNQN